ncbi:FAD-dependent oxidoreductase [Pseudonocardia sp. ICBG1034]|uniref:FAD-dependent oxidoreductase n=1 Tax=Pseudonocardia sp. ICBG1034 TaxID=2844381 RepID=UPI001CCA2287|nr:FAD-dependent oxidoreductase [Pseudonocardia sp. ICBG1034]
MDDVVIVGAGPVGLLLACELGLAGCSVTVLEREPGGENPWRTAPLGMRGLTAASVEAFHRRGLLPALREAVGPTPAGFGPEPAAGGRTDPGTGAADGMLPPPRAGHFAGIMLSGVELDETTLPPRLPTPATDRLMIHLADVEGMLARRADELGVRILRDTPVTGLDQDDDGVVVHSRTGTFAARWVVGCDGGRSAVRRLAGFDFVGTEPQFTGYVLHARVDDLDKLDRGFNLTPQGMYLRMPTDGHLGIMDFDGGAFDRSRPPTPEHLQEVLRRVSGTDVTLLEVWNASSFTDRAMQATTYRRDRVLLAGDAAHIHSPLGGQGLNSGLADALNLGWKLAATARGAAPDGLLDTYDDERHPVAAAVLDWSRAQVALMRPGPQAAALQSVVRDLLTTRDGAGYVYLRTSGAGLRLDLGDAHPMVGRVAPEFRLADGTWLGELTATGSGVLLDPGADPALGAVAHGWADRIRRVTGPLRDDLGTGTVLLRPDGVVAWVGGDRPDPTTLRRAARRWFGEPAA